MTGAFGSAVARTSRPFALGKPHSSASVAVVLIKCSNAASSICGLAGPHITPLRSGIFSSVGSAAAAAMISQPVPSFSLRPMAVAKFSKLDLALARLVAGFAFPEKTLRDDELLECRAVLALHDVRQLFAENFKGRIFDRLRRLDDDRLDRVLAAPDCCAAGGGGAALCDGVDCASAVVANMAKPRAAAARLALPICWKRCIARS